ncbi:deoxyribose-phosphate aldolase [Rhizobium sp. 2MFCol3.1]|uniref:deoxyribose-phosphate aldolase n=1 Tax=Rhizobium sp. 2MFCol3.1 TaxID=1246459 RepID=UPI0003723BDD|nr:deoxyribose-phosphate aldolase [Rhizobium sp. 2MFCol3.1]
MLTVDALASMIDHSIIDPNHTEADMIAGIESAIEYRAGRFTTQPFRVKAAKKRLDGKGIALQTYVGFPHGNDYTATKVLQAQQALDDGVDELDMVINISAFLSGDVGYVEDDIRAIVSLAKPYKVTVKGIIECFYLTREQRIAAARIVEAAGADFVKTSTGQRADMQASIAEDVREMRSVLKPETIIKASGGCFNLDAILLYYRNGARRFGASETANILNDFRARTKAGLTID